MPKLGDLVKEYLLNSHEMAKKYVDGDENTTEFLDKIKDLSIDDLITIVNLIASKFRKIPMPKQAYINGRGIYGLIVDKMVESDRLYLLHFPAKEKDIKTMRWGENDCVSALFTSPETARIFTVKNSFPGKETHLIKLLNPAIRSFLFHSERITGEENKVTYFLVSNGYEMVMISAEYIHVHLTNNGLDNVIEAASGFADE